MDLALLIGILRELDSQRSPRVVMGGEGSLRDGVSAALISAWGGLGSGEKAGVGARGCSGVGGSFFFRQIQSRIPRACSGSGVSELLWLVAGCWFLQSPFVEGMQFSQ